MSDENCNADEDPWPPEGTRVRVIRKDLFNGWTGRLLGPSKVIDDKYVVKLPGLSVAVWRHEIEVIDGQ